MKGLLFIVTTLAIAVSTLNNDTVPKKRIPDSVDSLLAKSKTNFNKANSSIKVAEKLQKENFEVIKSKIEKLELENKSLIQKIEHYEDTVIPVTDTVEQFNIFPSN
jgi:hypothetical protein